MNIEEVIEKHFKDISLVPEALKPFISDLLQASYPQEDRYRNILKHMDLGLVEFDNEGNISYVHSQFCKMTGYHREELLGKQASEQLVTQKFKPNFYKQFLHKTRKGSGPYEMQFRKKSGKIMWVLASAVPLYSRSGEIYGSLGIFLNINRQKRVEQRHIEAMEKARESARAKEEFLANMSHEIRTPMNAIMGMSELLENSPLNTKQKDYLHAITTSADHLLVIINDILDLSKVDSGKLTFESIGFSIPEIIRNVEKSLVYKAHEKGIELSTDIQMDSELVAVGDPTRLNQVLVNLVNNAIKFTKKGRVEISCIPLKICSKRIKLHFSVKDTGIGIAEENLNYIFNSFRQADNSITRQFGGTGLGLTICKKIIEAQSGNIGVNSVIGEGSEFFFDIVYRRGTENDLLTDEIPESTPQSLSHLHLLLAEDNKFNQMLILSLAEAWGCKIDTAENGMEVLDALDKQAYDLILMDMQMPILDGIATTKRIREHPDERIRDIPIIALTANSFTSDFEKCLHAGMNDYVSKPFEPNVLYNKIQQLANLPLTVIAANEPIFTTPMQSGLICRDGLLFQMAAGNLEFTVHLLEMFVEEVQATTKEMQYAVSLNDIQQLRKLAHRIKSSIESVATEKVCQPAYNIEQKATEENAEKLMENFHETIHELLKDCQQEIRHLQVRIQHQKA